MRVRTWKWKRFIEGKLWKASIEGPWYDDSEPVGEGDTEAEAIQDAVRIAEEMIQSLMALIRNPTVIRGTDQS